MPLSTGTCSKCDGVLDGSHASYCKNCFAEYVRLRRQADPEKAARESKEYRDRNIDWMRHQARLRYSINPQERAAYQRQWRADNPDLHRIIKRRTHLKSNYGLSMADFEQMWIEQDGKCAICKVGMELAAPKSSPVAACVDHDHVTGDIRSLLCWRCNNGLGCFSDDMIRMESALAYLLFHRKDT